MTPQDKKELRFILRLVAKALITLTIAFLMLILIFKL
jgi:hypothetical protein